MRPMPSPKGTNHEQLFLPDHFPLPNAGAAYDAALPRRTPRDRNEYSAPEEYEASIDILRDLLADYNLPPELIEGAVDRARRVIADRVRGAKYGAAAVRRSYDRHDRVTRDMPNPEAARGQEPLRSENCQPKRASLLRTSHECAPTSRPTLPASTHHRFVSRETHWLWMREM